MRRGYKRSSFFTDSIAGIIISIIIRGVLFLVGSLGLIFVLMLLSAKLEPYLLGMILRGVISAVMLFFTFFGKKRLHFSDIIASLAVVLTVWLPMLIGKKAGIAITMAALLALVAYIAYMHIVRRRTVKVLCWEWVYLLICHVAASAFQTYADDSKTLWFLILPAVMTIASVPLSVILIDRGMIRLGDIRMSEAVCAVIIIAVVTFGVFYCGTCNLNYVLDSSEPVKETAVIKEAEVFHGARSSISYFFHLDVNGKEISLEVTDHEYFNFNEGDEYKIELYEGAFGAPYYMSGE